jgi:hypothetical protein
MSLSARIRAYIRQQHVGLIALFFGVYGFIANGAAPTNTFGITNLELGDNLLHLVVAAWAFLAAMSWGTSKSMMMGR